MQILEKNTSLVDHTQLVDSLLFENETLIKATTLIEIGKRPYLIRISRKHHHKIRLDYIEMKPQTKSCSGLSCIV